MFAEFCQGILFSKIYWAVWDECSIYFHPYFDYPVTDGQKDDCRKVLESYRQQAPELFDEKSLVTVCDALDLFEQIAIDNQYWLESPSKQ